MGQRRSCNLCLWIVVCMTGGVPLIFMALYWLCCKTSPTPRVLRTKQGFFDSVRSFPNERPRVAYVKEEPDDGLTFCLHDLLRCWNSCCCCCAVSFTKGMTLTEAVSRYEEMPVYKPAEVIKEIMENKSISLILEYMNLRKPKFFFRVLPSGSIREGFGQKSPSTSVLATDYDLMLVPDGIFAYDANSERNDRFPATFVAVDDPNQNPDRPTGYLWLEFKQKELEAWKDLCYERLSPDGVKYYLAQLAVLQMISNEIGNDYFIQVLKYLQRYTDGKSKANYKAEANLTGPALNITITKTVEGRELITLLNADFTLTIRCPDFPKAGKYFFERRNENDKIYWPSEEIVKKIDSLGCHVVPKRSESKLTKFQEEQMTESYLGTANSLEWRYSFSQAEMLLADHVPHQARIAYLAFKATVKVHINRTLDQNAEPHSLQSYALKSILFYEIEKHDSDYWNENDLTLKSKFFLVLINSLIACVEQRHCPHFWIKGVNLFQELETDGFLFFEERLKLIRGNPVKYVTSEWLEWNRIVLRNCCDCCIFHGEDYRVIIEPESKPMCDCCELGCSQVTKWQSCCSCGDKMEYDAVALDVY